MQRTEHKSFHIDSFISPIWTFNAVPWDFPIAKTTKRFMIL